MSHSGPTGIWWPPTKYTSKGGVVILRVLAQVKYTRALESRSWVLCKASALMRTEIPEPTGDITGMSENYVTRREVWGTPQETAEVRRHGSYLSQ